MGLIDVHCHLVALPAEDNGCLVSKKMIEGPLGRLVAWQLGLPIDRPAEANRLFVDNLLKALGESKRVSQAVLLGLDGVYDETGRLDEGKTPMLVSNDAVFAACARSGGKLLPGVSVNPARRDAVDELERCAQMGAVLVKVLPNAQNFDPAQARFKEFYRVLAKHRLPLLSHIGEEFSVHSADQTVGNPERLRLALDEGAPVIAAHGCSSGRFISQPHLPVMLEMVKRYPLFYSDLSAMTLPNRASMLLHLRKHPEVFDRLLYATDWPLVVFWPGANYFDRQAAAMDAAGVRMGADPAKVLRLPK